MKRKRIKIRWDELEDAFNSQHDELASLDTVTGHVVLEGEGEEDDPTSAGTPTVTRSDWTHIEIHPPDETQKIEWMRAFLGDDSQLSGEVVDRLSGALDAEDPAAAVSEVLRDNPDERAAWFLYRADRLRDYIDRWLDTNGVESTEPPPWKG